MTISSFYFGFLYNIQLELLGMLVLGKFNCVIGKCSESCA